MTTIVGRDQTYWSKPWVRKRTIQVDSAGVNPLDFRLSRTQANSLFENGRAAATRFLKTWDWEDYLATFRGATRRGRST
jgi:NTE family protein